MKSLKVIPALCILSGILLSTSIFAQRNTSEGYTIDLKGDTIHGKIFMNDDLRAGTSCTFYRAGEKDPVRYRPEELSAFRVTGGKYYVSREVEVFEKKQQLFLEYLIKGRANLYYLKTAEEHYFIETTEGKIIELSEPQVVLHTDSGMFIRPGRYKGKLLALMNDCQGIDQQINRTSLNHGSLIKLAKNYHEKVCTDEKCIIYEREINKNQLLKGVYAGPVFSSIAFGNSLKSDFGPGFLIGGKLELVSGKSSFRNGSFEADLMVQRFMHSSLKYAHDDYSSEPVYLDGIKYIINRDKTSSLTNSIKNVQALKVDWKATMIKIPLSVNFYQWGSRLQTMVGIGTSTMLLLTQNKNFEHPIFTSYYGRSIPSFFVGFQGRTGVRYKISENHFLALNLGYEYLTTTNINEILRVKIKSLTSRLEYTFP